tara:strand:- start:171 stop:923 length:753 start_codon:yes stop_codon:yes gene_type:complete
MTNTPFEQAFSLLKMPFVPGSVRPLEGEFMEGDDDHAPAQKFVGDFYDPTDDRTLPINIEPARDWTGEDNPSYGFGRKHKNMDRMDAAVIPMDMIDEDRESEMQFGMAQKNPFAAIIDNLIERVYVPTDLRRREMGQGLLDALQEYRQNFGNRGQMKPSRENTGDMLGLLASRGLFPNGLAQIPKGQNFNDPDTQYMHSEWPSGAKWQNAEDANFPRKVPKNQWNQRWQDAGKRFADYQDQQEQEDDEEW